MTTTDSDSESQDSDDGRRFRFEATRKDAITTLQSRKRHISPYSNTSKYESRLGERLRHTRREDKNIFADTKERINDRNNYEERQSAKEQTSANCGSKRNKEVRERNKKTCSKPPRDFQKNNSSCRDARILKSRDGKRKRSRDKSWENKSRDTYRKHSRERERLSQREKSSHRQKRCRKKVKDGDKEKPSDLQPRDIEQVHDPQDCKDLNLSDFDIVSDTEGNSNDSDGMIESTNDQIEKRDCNLKEKDEVKFKNGDELSGQFSSNAADFSDFLVASSSAESIRIDDIDIILHRDYEAGLKNSDLKREPEEDIDEHVSIDGEIYGPTLPPSVKVKSYGAVKIIGPSLPNHLQKSVTQNMKDEGDIEFGPVLPLHLQKGGEATVSPVLEDATTIVKVEEDEEDGVMGPLPADHPTLKHDSVQQQLEYRAQLIRRELAEVDDGDERRRDEWMTELPRVDASNLRLEARKFRMRPGPDLSDRSDWTDTPADRAKKKRQCALGKTAVDIERAKTILPEESRRRKGKSLLEIHQKKLHEKKKRREKEAKKSGNVPERRPFDRDVDLQVHRSNEARKDSAFMKAAALHHRFSTGKS